MPESNSFWIKDVNVVPRGVSWRRRVRFVTEHWYSFFGHNDNDVSYNTLKFIYFFIYMFSLLYSLLKLIILFPFFINLFYFIF